MPSELGRNDPCHCGSGKKYKSCHLDQDEAAAREARSKASETAAPEAPAEGDKPAAAQPKRQRPAAHQPWKRSGQNARGFQKHSAPRKVGGS